MIDNLIMASACQINCGDAYGSGCLVAKGRILTARHCVLPAVESGEKITLTFLLASGDVVVAATLVDHTAEFDACLLAFDQAFDAELVTLRDVRPRGGSDWLTFGFPVGKVASGHRLKGKIAQLLPAPKLRMDLDLSVDADTAVNNYRGFSGGPVVVDGANVGLLRLQLDGTLGAISVHALEKFLTANDVAIAKAQATGAKSPPLAERLEFQKIFEQRVRAAAGAYLFLEGGHGLGKTTFCDNYRPVDKTLLGVGAYCLYRPDDALSAIYRAQPDVFFDWLLTTVAALVTGQAPRKDERKYSELVTGTSQVLRTLSEHAVAQKHQAILFVDGLNEAAEAGGDVLAKLVGLLPLELPANITVVLTAPNYTTVAGSLADRVKPANVLTLAPLSVSASSKYCRRRLLPARATAALIGRICEKASGHPLYLRYIIEFANEKSGDDALDEFPTLTGPIEDYYRTVWTRLLPDTHAVQLVALMARLRWGIPVAEFVKVLNLAEQATFVTAVGRIRHLLAGPDSTAIYHLSFASFAVAETAAIDQISHGRLAAFCLTEPAFRYCRINSVFHLSRGTSGDRQKAVIACNQDWLDGAISLVAEPDALLADIGLTVALAIEQGMAVALVRLLLLSHRTNFRFNVLLAQSAKLMADALISLGRPGEALTYVFRAKTLIIYPGEALDLAYRLAGAGFNGEALELLGRLEDRFIASYEGQLELREFITCCAYHIQAVLFGRLAGGPDGLKQVIKIGEFAKKMSAQVLKNRPDLIEDAMIPVTIRGSTHFLSFRDHYASLADLRRTGATTIPPVYLRLLCLTLIEFEVSTDRHLLSKRRTALAAVFADIQELATAKQTVPESIARIATDSLVRLGAGTDLVKLMAGQAGPWTARPLQLRAKNGVDVDFQRLREDQELRRTMSFLDVASTCPKVPGFTRPVWFSSLERLVEAMFWCEGRARRAKADSDADSAQRTLADLRDQVLASLQFTLAQRVEWKDGYAVPEQVLPFIYRALVELLNDCYPEEIPPLLRTLVASSANQFGLYTEGYREAVRLVLVELGKENQTAEVTELARKLLVQWREHVLRGVENRRELVPEILRLIPLHVQLGFGEEAANLYQRMLAVSMGPTWYKEDQLGLVTVVLGKMPASDDVRPQLSQAAGYLDRASGEMTFQRFIRQEKSTLVGEVFRRGYFADGFGYFRRQSCGSHPQLLAEATAGDIDKPYPDKGGRFPGCALEEQAVVLQIVEKAPDLNWRLGWALLEVFHCGDERHHENYASGLARIANAAVADSANLPDLLRRLDYVLNAETDPESRDQVAGWFAKALDPAVRPSFSSLLGRAKPVPDETKAPGGEKSGTPDSAADEDDEMEQGMFSPGVFGRFSAFKKADKQLLAIADQLMLGNRTAAKLLAVGLLESLQKAEWTIWHDNLSESARRAEAVILEGETDPADIVRYYANLIKAEKNVPKWEIAQHLIRNITGLLGEAGRKELLDYVIEHVRLLVGDAVAEVAANNFLSAKSEEGQSMRETFRFLLWLTEHPKAQRRERAAVMIAWLFDRLDGVTGEAVAAAFASRPGFAAEVLCAVLDDASTRNPVQLWERIQPHLDLDSMVRGARHLCRLGVLRRIAERAQVGSASAALVVAQIQAVIQGQPPVPRVTASAVQLPPWVECIAPEWEKIAQMGFAGPELLAALHSELSQTCAPSQIRRIWKLENAVSTSFRESQTRPLNRWEGIVRTALSTVLFAHVPAAQFQDVERLLRLYNPTLADCATRGGPCPFAERLLAAIAKDDYSLVFADTKHVLLNLTAMMTVENASSVHIEAVAVIFAGAQRKRGFFAPALTTAFSSSDFPASASAGGPQETSSRVDLKHVLFGPFTPPVPTASFMKTVKAAEDDFVRYTWRDGRMHQTRRFGQPRQEGALLLIKAPALAMPPGKKLAWIVSQNGKIVTMVDGDNNRLL